MKNSILGALIIVLLAWIPVALAEDTPESIEKSVVASWDKISSLSAALNLNADFPMNIVAAMISGKEPDPNNTAKGKLVIAGSTDYLKKEGPVCSRLELDAALNEALKARLLFVFDGAEANLEYEFFGNVTTKKLEPKNIVAPGGKALFDALKANCSLAALPSEKVGDQDAYVLDATIKEPDPKTPVSKFRLWFAKDSGIVLKVEVFDAANAPFAGLTITDIKVNQPIAADRFKYTPPAPPAPKAEPAAEPATTPAK